jgi:replicative DNA helicase
MKSTEITDLALQVRALSTFSSSIETILISRGNEPDLPFSSLPSLNKKIWGLQKGLTVLAGRTSQGKSSIAMQWAFDIASSKKPVVFLSLEMSVEALTERLFCNIMQVDN